jgi:ubiquinone/menaquinone biosynthesis C-methylase UbiE
MDLKFLKTIKDKIYSFNQFERDQWVASQARGILPGAKVLDVGAGPCRYKHYFSHCVYKAHDFAKTPGQTYGELDYISDILNIPTPDRFFDAIICTEVLEHVPDPAGAVKEFFRILAPKGKLILTAPLGSGLHQEPYHYYGGFTPHWYRHVLEENGFTGVRVEPNKRFFKMYGQETIRFVNYIKDINLVLYLLFLPLKILIPIIAHLVDDHDKEAKFVVGYHVTARRK